MSDTDDFECEELGESAAPSASADASVSAEEGIATEFENSGTCLSCSAPLVGVYCINCGQKQDDLRKSLFLLGRSFVEDTFSFDSRMWRTLGLLAASPGTVPTQYSHGRRSQFTPPVRLFLIVSFLFFLTVGLTKTLFVGLEVEFKQSVWEAQQASAETAKDNGINLAEMSSQDCSFQGQMRFLVKERDLKTEAKRVDACVQQAQASIRGELETVDTVIIGEDNGPEAEVHQAEEIVERVFGGINWAVSNPREFNDAFNDWLPRVMFFMTPVLALILSLFLRRNALIFDHMVLSLYMHAVNFAIVGATLILAQIGLSFLGYLAGIGGAIYYIIALKRAYRRGWVKTLWTAFGSASLYMLVFGSILMTIVSSIVWRAAGG